MTLNLDQFRYRVESTTGTGWEIAGLMPTLERAIVHATGDTVRQRVFVRSAESTGPHDSHHGQWVTPDTRVVDHATGRQLWPA
jgi:hypothetical protein